MLAVPLAEDRLQPLLGDELSLCIASTPSLCVVGGTGSLVQRGMSLEEGSMSVLGPLVSRERLERGDLQKIIRELARCEYAIPGTRRCYLGERTIQAWFYAWRKQGIAGLVPKVRFDRGQSKLSLPIQAVLAV